MVDVTYLRTIAPELTTETDARLNFFLGLVSPQMLSGVWGSNLDMATALLTCHLVTLANRQGAGGTLSSQTVGGVSVSYSTPSQSNTELNATSYGQMYLKLRKTLTITPMIV